MKDIQNEQKQLKLTTISLVALGNLASTDRQIATQIARTTMFREVIETISHRESLQLYQQAARAISCVTRHNDTTINRRIQTLVGLDGFKTLLNINDNAVYFYCAKSLASLVLESL